MSMTQDQFDEWIETQDGQDEYYDWMVDTNPEFGKHKLFDAVENCLYIEDFMEYKGVAE